MSEASFFLALIRIPRLGERDEVSRLRFCGELLDWGVCVTIVVVYCAWKNFGRNSRLVLLFFFALKKTWLAGVVVPWSGFLSEVAAALTIFTPVDPCASMYVGQDAESAFG